MPKIDTSLIEGYETMSEAEKITALLSLEIPEVPDMTGYVDKKVYDKTASELADTKKKLRDRMTAGEQADVAMKEELRLAQESRDAAQKELSILKTASEYIKLGYSPDMARSASEALCGGDTMKLFEIQKQFNDERDRKMKEQLERQLTPSGSFTPPNEDDPSVKLAKALAQNEKESQDRSQEALKYFIR